jgi:hypothetical protein
VTTDELFAEFFDHLGACPDVPPGFVEHCRIRERAGRDLFGDEYLRRDNELEATEEAADFAIYMMLFLLRRRAEGREEDRSRALEAARHVAIGWRLALELHHGEP